MQITYRSAVPGDEERILGFIRALAEYEHMSDQVVATAQLLREQLFEKKMAEVIFCLADGAEAGFALFFHNFSTFLGRPGLYLEDLFVLPEYRGFGCGRFLLQTLAALALERGCGRLEWSCLDWNTPSIGFYRANGAIAMDEWTVYRLTGEALGNMAGPSASGK